MTITPIQPWSFTDPDGDSVTMALAGPATPPTIALSASNPLIVDSPASRGRVLLYTTGWAWDDLGVAIEPSDGNQMVVLSGYYAQAVDARGAYSAIKQLSLSVQATAQAFSTIPSYSGLSSIGSRVVALVDDTVTMDPGQIGGAPVSSPVYSHVVNGVPTSTTTAALTITPAMHGGNNDVLQGRVDAGGLIGLTTAVDIAFPEPTAVAGTIPTITFTVGSPPFSVDLDQWFSGYVDGVELEDTTNAHLTTTGTFLNITPSLATAGTVTPNVRGRNVDGASPYKALTVTATAAVSFAAASNPVASGNGNPGGTFSITTPGTYTDVPDSIAYQAQRRLTANPGDPLVDISGATNPAGYVFVSGDIGYTVFWRQRGVKGATTVDTFSNSVAVVALPSTVTLTRDGADFTLTNVVSSGVGANGVLWAKVSAGAQLLSTSPQSSQLNRASGGTTWGTGPYWSHGLMVSPGNAAARFPGAAVATLGNRQASGNSGIPTVTNAAAGTTTWLGGQGFDAFLGWTGSPPKATTNWPYNHNNNKDPGATGSPLALTSGMVLVKAISNLTTVNSTARPSITKLVPLVIYGPSDTAPVTDDLCPVPAASTMVNRYNFGGIDVDALPNLPVTTSATFKPASILANMFERKMFLAAMDTSGRNLNPSNGDGAPVYPGDNWKQMEALLGLCTDRYTSTEKALIAKPAISEYTALAERFDQGLVLGGAGGNSGGFKIGIAFASYMLGQPSFLTGVLAATVQGTIPSGNYGASAAIGSSVFNEDTMYYTVTQALIDSPAYTNFPHIQNQLGQGEWWDSTNAVIGGPNSVNISVNNSVGGKEAYRHICMMVEAPGILAARLMGFTGLMGNASSGLLKAVDIYMQYRIANGQRLPGANANDPILNGILWLGDAWTQLRGTTGLYAIPSEPTTVPALTGSSPSIGSTGQMPGLTLPFAVNFTTPIEAVPGTVTDAVQIFHNPGGGMTAVQSMTFPGALSSTYTSTAGKVWISGRTIQVAPPSGGWVRGRPYEIRISLGGAIRNRAATSQVYGGAGAGVIAFTA